MSLDRLLDLCALTQVPLLVWGTPGVGKSAAISAWARRRNRACWTVIASLREPADFGGLPVVGAAGPDGLPAVAFAPPRFAVEAADRGGVIFLDELTTAPPAVQAALLRAVLDKAFGDLELDPARVLVVAAANPPEHAAGGWDLAPPLANRFAHHRYALDPGAWCDAFPGYWGAAPAIGFDGAILDPARWSRARAVVAAFLRARPALLSALPADESLRGGAWPSPRSWDFLSRLLCVAVPDLTGDLRGASLDQALGVMASCVGDGPALEMAQWLRELDLPDPEDLLTDPSRYVHPDRMDRTFAILASVAQAAGVNLTPARWKAAWKIFAAAARHGQADVAVAAIRDLDNARHRCHSGGSTSLPIDPEDLVPLQPVIRALNGWEDLE